ncbi:MAG TPA: LytTR family DNA-binding domain-containing protein [Longimicrobium sp.]|jgi:two-component system LytT family response regulator
MDEFRVLIVDDESLARERLRVLLESEPGITVVGEACDGASAIELIECTQPDLVLLDVQMPNCSGIDVITTVGADRMPAVIFATAFDEYAMKAFEVHAIDYLLKPISAERLSAAVTRARQWIGKPRGQQISEQVLASLAEPAATTRGYRERIAVRQGTRYTLVRVAEINSVEADNNNVLLRTNHGVYSMRSTMREMEDMLDPQRFIRIHRSIILNVDRVTGIESWGMGEFLFMLVDGSKLTSSRRYRTVIQQAFGC